MCVSMFGYVFLCVCMHVWFCLICKFNCLNLYHLRVHVCVGVYKGCPKFLKPILWSGFTCSTWRAFMCHNVPYSESRLQVQAHEGSSCAQQMSPFCQNLSWPVLQPPSLISFGFWTSLRFSWLTKLDQPQEVRMIRKEPVLLTFHPHL